KRLIVLSIVIVVLLSLSPSIAAQSLQPYSSSGSIPPAWFQLAPSGGPPDARASFGQVLAYDQTNNRLIIFGGDKLDGTLLNDTWVLVGADGTYAGPKWIQLNTVNTPAPRKLHVGAYDAANNILIVYGGCLGLCTPIDNG